MPKLTIINDDGNFALSRNCQTSLICIYIRDEYAHRSQGDQEGFSENFA